MSRKTGTMPAAYFEALYQADGDPWRFRTSAYEEGKYAATLAALTRPRYRSALEIGCSIGVFTEKLGPRCDALLAVDASATALADARRACAAQPHVAFEAMSVPGAFPEGTFDLIVVSEVLYYLAAHDLRILAERCLDALSAEGEIVLCHWLGETDYPLTGAAASDLFVASAITPLPVHAILNDRVYRLDRLSKRPP